MRNLSKQAVRKAGRQASEFGRQATRGPIKRKGRNSSDRMELAPQKWASAPRSHEWNKDENDF